MTKIPDGHISMQEAYSRFIEKYDSAGVRFQDEPICKPDDAECNARWHEWERVTHAVYNNSMRELGEAFEQQQLVALYKVDGDQETYRIEGRTWKENRILTHSFYDGTFGDYRSGRDIAHLSGVAAYMKLPEFEAWLDWRFPPEPLSTYDGSQPVGNRMTYEQAISILCKTIPYEAWTGDIVGYLFGAVFVKSRAGKGRLSINAVTRDDRDVSISEQAWKNLEIDVSNGTVHRKTKKGLVPGYYTDLAFHRKQIESLLGEFEIEYSRAFLSIRQENEAERIGPSELDGFKAERLSDDDEQWLKSKAETRLPPPILIEVDDAFPADTSVPQEPPINIHETVIHHHNQPSTDRTPRPSASSVSDVGSVDDSPTESERQQHKKPKGKKKRDLPRLEDLRDDDQRKVIALQDAAAYLAKHYPSFPSLQRGQSVVEIAKEICREVQGMTGSYAPDTMREVLRGRNDRAKRLAETGLFKAFWAPQIG